MPIQLDDKSAAEAAALIAKREIIMAVKLVRERTGCGLAEAKEWVDTHRHPGTLAGQGQSAATQPTIESAMPAIDVQIRSGNLIQAIKLYRDATGLGLKESKDFVDDRKRQLGAGAATGPRKSTAEILVDVDQMIRSERFEQAVNVYSEWAGLSSQEARKYLDIRKMVIQSRDRAQGVPQTQPKPQTQPATAPPSKPVTPVVTPTPKPAPTPPQPAKPTASPHAASPDLTAAQKKQMEAEQAARFEGPKKSGCFGMIALVACGYMLWRFL